MNVERAHLTEVSNGCPDETLIEYVLVDHSPENQYKIADILIGLDSDIIAIEKIKQGSFGTGTAEEKNDLSNRMTEFMATGNNITESAAEYFPAAELLFTKLLDTLKGSGKRIVLIDIGTDDEGYYIYERMVELRNEYSEKYHDKSISREELKELYLNCQIASAQANEYRESVMKRQIATLAENNPGSKIAVTTGAIHTSVSHDMNQNINTSRIFVPTDDEAATYKHGEKMRFRDGYRYERAIQFNLRSLGLSVLDERGMLIVQSDVDLETREKVEPQLR